MRRRTKVVGFLSVLFLCLGAPAVLLADATNYALSRPAFGREDPDTSRVAAYLAFEVNPEARRLVTQARGHVARAAHERADEAFSAAVELDPDFALPEYVRYLRLAGRDDQLAVMMDGIEAKGLSTLTKARVLFASGRRDDGIALLRSSADVLEARDPAAVRLLARQLPQVERHVLLAKSIPKANNPSARAVLFKELFDNELSILVDQPELILPAVDAGIDAVGPDRREILRVLDSTIMVWQQGTQYFPLRQRLFELAPSFGPGSAWLVSRMLVREERFDEALAAIQLAEEKYREHALWPLLVEERAEILRSLGRLDETRTLLEALAAGTDNPTLLKDAARAQIAVNEHKAALATLDKIDESKLGPDARRGNSVLRLLAYSRLGDLDALIRAYGKATEILTLDDLDLFHGIIFRNVRTTEEHRRMEEMIREMFQEEPEATPSQLWFLAAVAAAEANRPPNQLEALYNAVIARPTDMLALQLLADAVVPIARELATVPEERIAIPPAEVQKLMRLAEESLIVMAQAQPLDPTGYLALIDLYKAKGVDGIPARILEINARKTWDARIIGVAAYALAIKGYPEDALMVYDRALEFDPWNYDVKMNRAACLTRLGRWKEAAEVYQDAVLNGYRGRSYHIHEMLGRLYDCFDQMKDVEGFVTWVNTAVSEINPAWRDETLIDMGNLLANKGHLNLAEQFYRRLMREATTEKNALKAYDNYGGALFHTENFAGAIAVYTEALERFPAAEGSLAIALAKAESHFRLQQHPEAIATLEAIAGTWPESQRALNALHRAAGVAAGAGNPAEEKRLLEAYLASAATDFIARRQAEARLAALTSSAALGGS